MRGFISVGFAGALTSNLRVPQIFEPKKIVCAADETEISNPSGAGTLVSAGAVAGQEQKVMLAKKHAAEAVDMEGYSVADVARIYGIVRADLANRGEIIGANDLWIAAHAQANDLILVSNNEREFKRIASLKLENWMR